MENKVYFAENVDEDMICDIVSCSNEFINGVIKDYIKAF